PRRAVAAHPEERAYDYASTIRSLTAAAARGPYKTGRVSLAAPPAGPRCRPVAGCTRPPGRPASDRTPRSVLPGPGSGPRVVTDPRFAARPEASAGRVLAGRRFA